MDPLVSIVIPSYNQGAFLEEAVLSVLEQSYPRVELLVIDGGSEDESVSIIERYSDQIAYWVSEPDRGQTDAINKGMQRAAGEFVWWLNSDDMLLSDAVAASVAYLEENPGVDLVYGDLIWIDENGRFLREYRYEPFDFLRNIVEWVDISQAGALARLSALQEIGFLDNSMHYLMDRDLWIRLALQGKRIEYLPRPMARFRIHEQSKTQSGSPQAVVERYRTTHLALTHPLIRDDVAAKRRAKAKTHAASARVYMKCGEYQSALGEIGKLLRTSPAALCSQDSLTALFWSVPGIILGHERITAWRRRLRTLRRGKNHIVGKGNAGGAG